MTDASDVAPVRPDEQLDATVVAAYLRGKLLPYQVPLVMQAMAELPRTPSMKVSMPAVRELFAE